MSVASRKFREQFDGYRGDCGLPGRWISLQDATRLCVTGEEWWRTDLVEPIQHDPTGPSDEPVWHFKNGDMYLGQWKKATRGCALEEGKGITYNHYPYEKARGLICAGEWKNGHIHGKGESYWLKTSKIWQSNRLPGSAIEQPSEETGRPRGIPFRYKGNYKQSLKSDPKAVVTLKDGTTRVGPWKDNLPVGDWFQHSSAATAREDSDSSDSEEDPQPEKKKAMSSANKRKCKPAVVTPNRKRRSKPPSAAAEEESGGEEDEDGQPKKKGARDVSPTIRRQNHRSQRSATPRRVAAVKQETDEEDNHIVCLDESDDDESTNGVAVKQEAGAAAAEIRDARVQQISQYITNDIIGNNPNPATMKRYAERLHDLGFESVEMIHAYLKRRHVELFDWMTELHKEIFLQNLS